MEKIFANYICDQGLVFFFKENSQKSTAKKQPDWKMRERMNRHFTKDDIWMADKHMKMCETLLITRNYRLIPQ